MRLSPTVPRGTLAHGCGSAGVSGDKLQLKNLTVLEARGRMLSDAARLGVETVALPEAIGRVRGVPARRLGDSGT